MLIFTQFTEMGNLLKHFITERFSETPLFYHGGCTLKQRKEMVDAFQTNRTDKIFILSLKAAGTGLNLTAASHVIHFFVLLGGLESQGTPAFLTTASCVRDVTICPVAYSKKDQ